MRGSRETGRGATQNLSRYNLDFDGLTVRSITVDGDPAKWNRARGELTVRPQAGILDGTEFEVVVEYDGVPEALVEFGEPSGFMQTEDGVVVLGEPHVASTWFPANDHPIDKAWFSFSSTAPEDLEVVATGILEGTTTAGGWTTWDWEAADPMATCLASMAIGEFDVREYQIGCQRRAHHASPRHSAPALPPEMPRWEPGPRGDRAPTHPATADATPAGSSSRRGSPPLSGRA